VATATGNLDPEGITTIGLGLTHTAFADNLDGDEEIAPLFTERIDAALATLNIAHHFGRGVAAGLAVPIGSIRVDPVGTSPRMVSGFGDIETSASYELGRIWGLRGRHPSLRVRLSLRLPSGKTSRIEDTAGDVPPNIIALGSGVFGAGGALEWTQPLSRSWSLRGRIGALQPLSHNEVDLKFGRNETAALGALFRIRKNLIVTGEGQVQHRAQTRHRLIGPLVNSGGTVVAGQIGLSYFAGPKFAVGATTRLPVYQKVKGAQIAQSYGFGFFVATTFGGEAEHGHEHGGEPEHGGGHEHGGEAEHSGGHEHGGGHEHSGGHEHGHAVPAEPVPPAPHEHSQRFAPNIADLARGGQSFPLGSAAVPGHITVVDFWAEWCAPCKDIDKMLTELATQHENLAVRRVEVPSDDSPVAREHVGEGGLPLIWILGPDGSLIGKMLHPHPSDLHNRLEDLLGKHQP
jgi:thiol-disulfide isomerase/thioredoxin